MTGQKKGLNVGKKTKKEKFSTLQVSDMNRETWIGRNAVCIIPKVCFPNRAASGNLIFGFSQQGVKLFYCFLELLLYNLGMSRAHGNGMLPKGEVEGRLE